MTHAALLAHNGRLVDLEDRLTEQSRKAARERANLERRHYEDRAAADAAAAHALGTAKAREHELRSRLQAREQQLSAAAADARRYRQKFADAASELDATRAYSQQLLALQPVRQDGEAQSGAAALSPLSTPDASALAVELASARAEAMQLADTVAELQASAARERVAAAAAARVVAEQHERITGLEGSLRAGGKEASRLTAALEAERAAAAALRSQLRGSANTSTAGQVSRRESCVAPRPYSPRLVCALSHLPCC